MILMMTVSIDIDINVMISIARIDDGVMRNYWWQPIDIDIDN